MRENAFYSYTIYTRKKTQNDKCSLKFQIYLDVIDRSIKIWLGRVHRPHMVYSKLTNLNYILQIIVEYTCKIRTKYIDFNEPSGNLGTNYILELSFFLRRI